MNIGITGTGSLIGQAIIKSINDSSIRKNVRLIGFDYFEDTVGSYWVDENHILPDILKPNIEEEWLEKLCEIISSEKINLLFMGIDFELLLAAKHKDYILEKTGCQVLVSNERVIEIADDKYLTYKFLKDNNLYYPESFLPSDDLSKLEFPCILKPRIGERSRGVYKINTREELDERLKTAKDPIIQELVGDGDSEYTCGVIYLEGEVKEVIALQRSLKEGNTFKATHSLHFPEIIYTYLKDVGQALKAWGCCNFQLRMDKNGIPKIFEINSRHSGTTYMRSLFGFNEIEYIISYLLEGKTEPFKLKEGTVVRYFDEFLID